MNQDFELRERLAAAEDLLRTASYELAQMRLQIASLAPPLLPQPIEPDRILSAVAAYSRTTLAHLQAPTSKRPGRVLPRLLVTYLLRKLTPLSYPEIGALLCCNHSTAVYRVSRFERRLTQEPDLKAHLAALVDALRGGP